MKLPQLLPRLLTGFCVATLLAEGVVLGVLWWKGYLSEDKGVQLLAVAYDVDLPSIRARLEQAHRPIEAEQLSFQEVLEARKLARLDLDLREIAADKGLLDVRHLDYVLAHERQQYERLKQRFDQRLQQIQQGTVDDSLREVQRQLESVDAKLAKDQILRLLADTAIDPDVAMQSVVTMIKNMPLDKRKKIIAEFKTPDEAKQLEEILRQVRLGVPTVEVLRQARQQMERFEFKE